MIRVAARSSTLSFLERTIVAGISSSYWTTLKKKLRTTNLIRIKIRAQLRVSLETSLKSLMLNSIMKFKTNLDRSS